MTTCAPRPHEAIVPDAKQKLARPRLGFLGLGWIGKTRLQTIAQSGLAQIVAIADTSSAQIQDACNLAPDAVQAGSFDELLDLELDGLVIATPSALHASQTIQALNRGLAVFCQKPLGRNGRETREVIETARAVDRLLRVDLSYRWMTCVQQVHKICQSGELGQIYAIDLNFHNAYGPDKAWFYDHKLSGGGCVIDLGIHLVDLALWNLDFPKVIGATSRLFAQGQRLNPPCEKVEDYATAMFDLDNGVSMRLACSWKLPAGCDAIISGEFYGTKGGVGFRNLDGSFFDFVGERFRGTKREMLNCLREQDWGGRAALNWTRQLSLSRSFDPAIDELGQVAEALDCIYLNA